MIGINLAIKVLFLMILALGLGWWFGGYVFDAYQSEAWLATQGKITKSFEWKIPSRGRPKYETHYVYEYNISNRTYTCERYGLEGYGDYPGDTGPYKVGEQVAVYYNPKNPQEALLKRTKFQDACGSLIIPAIIMIFATVAVLSSKKG